MHKTDKEIFSLANGPESRWLKYVNTLDEEEAVEEATHVRKLLGTEDSKSMCKRLEEMYLDLEACVGWQLIAKRFGKVCWAYGRHLGLEETDKVNGLSLPKKADVLNDEEIMQHVKNILKVLPSTNNEKVFSRLTGCLNSLQLRLGRSQVFRRYWETQSNIA